MEESSAMKRNLEKYLKQRNNSFLDVVFYMVC